MSWYSKIHSENHFAVFSSGSTNKFVSVAEHQQLNFSRLQRFAYVITSNQWSTFLSQKAISKKWDKNMRRSKTKKSKNKINISKWQDRNIKMYGKPKANVLHTLNWPSKISFFLICVLTSFSKLTKDERWILRLWWAIFSHLPRV